MNMKRKDVFDEIIKELESMYVFHRKQMDYCGAFALNMAISIVKRRRPKPIKKKGGKKV